MQLYLFQVSSLRVRPGIERLLMRARPKSPASPRRNPQDEKSPSQLTPVRRLEGRLIRDAEVKALRWYAERVGEPLICGSVTSRIIAKVPVSAEISGSKAEQGAQIDLLIGHRDGIINLCERKFTDVDFEVDTGTRAN